MNVTVDIKEIAKKRLSKPSNYVGKQILLNHYLKTDESHDSKKRFLDLLLYAYKTSINGKNSKEYLDNCLKRKIPYSIYVDYDFIEQFLTYTNITFEIINPCKTIPYPTIYILRHSTNKFNEVPNLMDAINYVKECGISSCKSHSGAIFKDHGNCRVFKFNIV